MAIECQITTPRIALAVMARYPAIGVVKTRLGRRIGAERACMLYRAFLQDIEARFDRKRRALVWVFHPPGVDFSAIVTPGARCLPQSGADLGARMLNGFHRLSDEGFARVIMIGADVPHVPDASLDEAENRLDGADLVLGPSRDGGYYLIAMREPHDVFSGIQMSTGTVLDETLLKAAALGLRVHLLPTTFDVDEVRDLTELHGMLAREGAVRLPRTAAVLAELKQAGALP